MKAHALGLIRRGLWIGKMLFSALATIGLATTAAAQSTDRDNPTPLAANEIRGQAPGKKVEYYYTFLAGPGDLVITIDSGAKGSFSEFKAELFDMEAERLAYVQVLPYPGETSRKVGRAMFGAQQPVLLRLTLDRDAAQYMARIGGAAQFAGADASFSAPAAATPGDLAAQPTTDAATPPVLSSTETSTPPAPDPTAATPGAGKVSGLKKFWLKLSSAGEVLGLSNLGKLRIEMKDGTTQEIGLSKIKKVFAPKGADAASAEPANESWQRLWMKLGSAGELANLAASGSMRLEHQDGSSQQFDLTKVKKVSIKK